MRSSTSFTLLSTLNSSQFIVVNLLWPSSGTFQCNFQFTSSADATTVSARSTQQPAAPAFPANCELVLRYIYIYLISVVNGISQKIHPSDHEHNHYQAVSKAPSHGMETGWYGMPEITFLYLDRPGEFP